MPAAIPSSVLSERRLAALLRALGGLTSCTSCLAIDAQLPHETVKAAGERFRLGGSYRLTSDVCVLCGAHTEVLYFSPFRPDPRGEFGGRDRAA